MIFGMILRSFRIYLFLILVVLTVLPAIAAEPVYRVLLKQNTTEPCKRILSDATFELMATSSEKRDVMRDRLLEEDHAHGVFLSEANRAVKAFSIFSPYVRRYLRQYGQWLPESEKVLPDRVVKKIFAANDPRMFVPDLIQRFASEAYFDETGKLEGAAFASAASLTKFVESGGAELYRRLRLTRLGLSEGVSGLTEISGLNDHVILSPEHVEYSRFIESVTALAPSIADFAFALANSDNQRLLIRGLLSLDMPLRSLEAMAVNVPQELLSALQKKSQLKNLHVEGVRLNDEFLTRISLLPYQLESFSTAYGAYSADGIAALGRQQKNLRSLQLGMSNSSPVNGYENSIDEIIYSPMNLQVFSLWSYNSYHGVSSNGWPTDFGSIPLKELLSSKPDLEVLDLGVGSISKQQIKYLVETDHKLSILVLRSNPLVIDFVKVDAPYSDLDLDLLIAKPNARYIAFRHSRVGSQYPFSWRFKAESDAE